jgi:hypothetical protein
MATRAAQGLLDASVGNREEDGALIQRLREHVDGKVRDARADGRIG